MSLNYILSFLISGSILLLAFILLVNPLNTNKKGNFYFGLFLLVWSTFWLDEAFTSEEIVFSKIFIIIKVFIQFLAPIFFYISIKFYTSPYNRFRKKHIILFFIPVVYLIVAYLSSFDSYSAKILNLLFTTGNALFYSVLAYITIINHQKNIEFFISNKEPIDLNWIKNIVYTIIITIIIVVINSTFINATSLNIYINLCFLAIVYMIAYFSIKQREIYPEQIDLYKIVNSENQEIENKKNKELISSSELEILKCELLRVMEIDKPYLDNELNLLKLADKLSLSTHQLSFIINNGFNENFFQFINKYKVEKAKELLTDPNYKHYTIVAIGFDAGFNSKTAFNTTFKKITSYTPSEYRKIRSNL